MKFVRIIALAALLVTVVIASGCARVAEETVEEMTGVEVSEDGNKVTIESEGDDVTYEGQGGTLPEEFPADFPIYDGQIEQSHRVTVGGSANWAVVIQTSDPYAKVLDFYKTELPAADWAVGAASESEMDWGTVASIQTTSPDGGITGVVNIDDRPEGAAVTINLTLVE
jgi:hypothetical protein